MKPFVQLIGKYKLHVIMVALYLLAGHIASATIRYVKPAATGTGTGLSWTNASGDEIWVKFGTYFPTRLATTGVVTVGDRRDAFVLKAGVNIYGGFLGIEIVRNARNYTSNVTVLSGDIGNPGTTTLAKSDNCYHVVIAAGPLSGNGLLDGFSIMNGYANAALASTVNAQANAVVHNSGGAVYIINASPTIKNCTIKRNEALNGAGGAGIFSGSTAAPVINNCTISNNSTTGNGCNGAGMYMASATASISNCNFSSNTSSWEAGGMYIATTAVPTITDCDFTNNTSSTDGGGITNYATTTFNILGCGFTSNTGGDFGGGMYNYFSSPSLTSCQFINNTAPVGAGLYNTSSAPIVNQCRFTGNMGTAIGGGMSNELSSSPTVTYCIFSGNSSNTGPGGGMRNSGSSSPTITNCIFSGNKGAGGAGMSNDASSPTITNCSFSGNLATDLGAGIRNEASANPTIKNCIFWGDVDSGFPVNEIFNVSSTPIVTFSTVQGFLLPGVGNINTDPLFVNPQSPILAPSTLGDYRLQRCSPAIDAGNNAAIAGFSTDLDGNTRIINTTVDMGAYEKQYALPGGLGIVYVDATKNGDGKTWATAVPELADALKAAKYNSSITEIWVAKGTYNPLYDAATLSCSPADNRDKSFVLVNNVKVYGGFAGGEITIVGRNFVTNETILSGEIGIANDNTDNCYHVAICAGAVGTAAWDGFTVTKGNANGTGDITVNENISDRVRGAGITNLSSSPAISNCIISANAAGAGAGIANLTAAPLISNCTFLSNTAIGSGGAMDNYLGSAASINSCLFSGNDASSGGAVMNSGGSSLTIKNSIFSGNAATDGGAFYNHASTTATITNCLFNGNNASNGAAMYFRSSSPQINNCTVASNLASVDGGGILNNNSSPVINNIIVWANSAVTNNNISIVSGTPSIKNSIIEGGFAGGTNIINSDPLFLSPQPAAAAPTNLGDYHLQACSPAINLGDNNLIPGGIITDLDGNTRIKFIDVDMGAYEVQTQDLTQSTWRGINTNWNNKVNWCGGYIPTATTNVTIPAGLVNYPTTAAANAVKNITLGNSTSVTVSNIGSLSINGTYANSGCNITNNGNWIMTGSAAGQSFPGSSGIISAMNNLEINNPSGIAFDKSFSITGSLIPTTGNINVNNNIAITLKSAATATASIAKIQTAASISYTGSGAFIVERFINTGTNTGIGEHAKSWQFLATPTTGQTIFQSWQESGATPAAFGTWITGTGIGFDVTSVSPSIKYFNQASFNWTPVINTGISLQNKLGYMLFVRGDRTVTTFNGLPNNTTLRSRGQLFSPTNLAPPVPVPANTFQSFGNPYASRIEFNKVLLASTGINDVFYVWDPKLPGTYNLGGYQTITGIAGYIPTVGTPPTGNAATAYYPAGIASPYIESGQAVFVKGNATGGNVNFNEGEKAASSWLVNRLAGNNEIENRQLLFTTLFTNTGEIADGNIVAFEHGFGNDVNEKDAIKLMNGGENFGFKRDENILAVEAREPVTINDTLQYYMSNLRQQDYQLRFAAINMQAVNRQAYLIDRFSGLIKQISFTDSTYVNFTVTGEPASKATDRFIVVFRLATPLPVTFIDIKAYHQRESVDIEWQVADEINIRSYIIEKSIGGIYFDSIGSSAARANNGAGIIKYDYPDTYPVEGVNFYRIKSIGTGGAFQYSKIVSMKMPYSKPWFTVFPNPVKNNEINIKLNVLPVGKYRYFLYNSAGQLLLSGTINHIEPSAPAVIKLEVHLAKDIYLLKVTDNKNYTVNEKIILD